MAGVWLDNWRGLKNLMLLGAVSDSVRADWDTVVNTSGRLITASTGNGGVSPMAGYYNGNSGRTHASSPNALVFGTGDDAPSASDFCLQAKWTANLSRVALEETNSYDDSTYTKTKTIDCTVQNTGADAVTVREWGIESSILGNPVLLYRAVLSSPVTLYQYESATFRCTLRMRLTDPV
ncbi:MAG: hypothetical protein IJG08_03260 [Oscillospiraceae bacterium]|nr:hypothetical protein [Oscillospiraceae bacterium]